jgi:hydrogenase maturation protease
MLFQLKQKLLHAGHHEVGDGHGGSGGEKSRAIVVKNIPMVEGKMSFKVTTDKNGENCHSTLIVEEPLRHFEAICEGKSAEEVAVIVSRICGVCPFPYATAASKAAERAFGFKVSDQTNRLREIAIYANMLNSHVLHALDLTIPKFLHLNSVVELALNVKTPAWVSEVPLTPDFFAELEVVKAQIASGALETASAEVTALSRVLLRLHTVANELADMIGGRAVHSITITPGWMTSVPKENDLRATRDKLANAHANYDMLAAVYKQAAGAGNPKLPIREREFIALRGEKKYPFYGGLIGSTKHGNMTAKEFEQYKHEYVVDNSNSKQVSTDKSKSYMVGALARVNLNWDLLSKEAKKDAEYLGLSVPCYDPYMNTAAQVVEGRQVLIDVVKAIDELLAIGLHEEKYPNVKPRAGYGAGYLEAPRGLIWHEYKYNEEGLVTWANCIIPTGMNTGSMQEDLEYLGSHLVRTGHSDEDIEFILELLLTHYDPCNSCAVHVVHLDAEKEMKKAELAPDAKVAVVSIGNVLAGDDAIGHVIIEEMKSHGINGNVEYVHGGVDGLTLFEDLEKEKYDAVYFVDAVDGLAHVGDVIRLTGDDLLAKAKKSGPKFSLHQGDFTHGFRVAKAMGFAIPETIVFYGVQAGQTEVGMGLTPEIDTHEIAHKIIHEIEDLYGSES